MRLPYNPGVDAGDAAVTWTAADWRVFADADVTLAQAELEEARWAALAGPVTVRKVTLAA